MTHIDNIPHILQNGLTHSSSENANTNFVAIGDSQLISTRNNFILDNNRRLGDYIPFYFGARTPMLYVIQNGFNMVAPISPEKIIYCVSSIQKILDKNLEFVFTDGHAVDRFSTQYTIADIQNIDNILDRNALKAKYWKDEDDLDKKRRKEAEFLVLGDVPNNAILGYLTYNENAKNILINLGINTNKVHVKTEYYF
ncbi:type II toxin-antitoxin system toxin DNA ADP-ribosyl transferase DarT [Flectobacillus longus]|uniref:type II toxin-antitoxin system toxin DNA ADP-ribosyl transferase DarT n=1 Tax=Flectobacillus longus TaxID=2984207 RepID=UPI0024B6F4A2|nr:DUF4433 domain-containing protein [Flectobacillus longus]MDI9881304.1 DUF4433 domain-containing protein [Flectobacillus longus]